MGFLDQILHSLTSVLGSHQGQADPMVKLFASLLQQNGGLEGLLARFHQNGLGDAADSWVSSGENLAVSSDDVVRALGHEQIAQYSQHLDMDPSTLSSQLAEYLPKVVDHLTPNGQLAPQGDAFMQDAERVLHSLFER